MAFLSYFATENQQMQTRRLSRTAEGSDGFGVLLMNEIMDMDEKKPVFGNHSEDIQTKLDKKLGPEYISKRVGFGTSRIAYIEGWRVINLANQIFGYNGWSTEVKSVVIDFLDERQGKFSIGCTAIVRVTLTSGTYREDIGYGTVENERRKPAAFERAKKSAVTDALKRSLRGFGNALGNCLYDKDFLAKIDKVKFDPPDFDENNLFRPTDEISESSRTNTLHENQEQQQYPNKRRQLTKVTNTNPDSTKNLVKIENTVSRGTPMMAAPAEANSKNSSNKDTDLKSLDASKQDQDDLLDDSLMFSDDFQDDDLINMGNTNSNVLTTEKDPVVAKQSPTASSNPEAEQITFVTAKAATSVQNERYIGEESIFDPKYQAQSIRHTVDQTTSKHVPASVLKDKTMTTARDSVYEKFAPKGKQLSMKNNDKELGPHMLEGAGNQVPRETTPIKTNATAFPPAAAPRFAPPSKVVHPNGNGAVPALPQQRSTRREVGRPKINPLHARKPT
ncbi:CLL_collapsed_G0040540.mRNA.1.CDS.1 [Saccharomyces cerevisiae]|nr:CLL_HP2_G0035020.mRNA.1.CDS.1 [Saccharomyces cerevisiae]CAI6544866.1 CLL_HP2_G0035020.mRNA.1.CDS.1 [Saccharomyces cerevisiae]CAI6646438.1 CLL_HP1_G0040010.mRNA.1.CDS.1 [Saccharomyces cerevisiae]CAI7423964.1 CLL_collapsed_G0040540.mRNA.1.CDS.1 [Saccharomyces cerevisiae]